MWKIMYEDLSQIDKIKLYQPIYPEPVEDALFLILLYLLADASGASETPFSVPWVYSLTDDPFSEPPRAPDPSALSWTMAGPEGYEYEVPNRSNYFEFSKAEIEEALAERWRQLQSALTRAASGHGSFHPLTKHFFVKAFTEDGIDEIVALISCVEATLMCSSERYTDKLLKRYKKLVRNEDAYNSLKLAYRIRNKYLHSLGDPRDATTWGEIAKCRWAVAKAVDEYLKLANSRKDQDREALLGWLRL